MKLHIVFELDAAPDATLGQVAAIMEQASPAFREALRPVGEARLLRIKNAPQDLQCVCGRYPVPTSGYVLSKGIKHTRSGCL